MINLLTLPFFHDEINTCIDDNIAGLCMNQNLEYLFSFIREWKFAFDKNLEKVSDMIYINNELEKDVIEKYCGMILEDIKFNSFDELMRHATLKINNNQPSMLHVYRRSFPWDKYYLRNGVPDSFIHKALIIGIEKDRILFTDSFCDKINEYLDKSICENSSNGLLTTIEFIDDFSNLNDEEMFYIFQEYLKTQENMFEDIRNFAKEVNNNKEIELEFEPYGDMFEFSPLYNSLNKILRLRKKTKKLLTYFYNKSLNNDIKETINLFNEIVKKWDIVNSLFTKSAINIKYFSRETISKIIDEVASIEEEAYKKVISIERLGKT